MNYQDELSARLEAVRVVPKIEKNHTVSTKTLEEKLLHELSEEFEFSQYDLDESDILRTLKIVNILSVYRDVFTHSDALQIFYTIAKLDVITAKTLYDFLSVDMKIFKIILQKMSKAKLIFQNNDKELELTLEGKSLAQRLGVYIF